MTISPLVTGGGLRVLDDVTGEYELIENVTPDYSEDGYWIQRGAGDAERFTLLFGSGRVFYTDGYLTPRLSGYNKSNFVAYNGGTWSATILGTTYSGGIDTTQTEFLLNLPCEIPIPAGTPIVFANNTFTLDARPAGQLNCFVGGIADDSGCLVCNVSITLTPAGTGTTTPTEPDEPDEPEPPVTYTVSFVTGDGGSVVNPVTVNTGGTITEPTAPTKTGYTFDNWYKENTFTTLWNFSTDTVTADISLYARWLENEPDEPVEEDILTDAEKRAKINQYYPHSYYSNNPYPRGVEGGCCLVRSWDNEDNPIRVIQNTWGGWGIMYYPNCDLTKPVTGFAYTGICYARGDGGDIYPEMWLGKLIINGNEFDLSNPAEYWVNKNGVGIIPPQQFGYMTKDDRYPQGYRFWSYNTITSKTPSTIPYTSKPSVITPHEHMPDIVIYDDYYDYPRNTPDDNSFLDNTSIEGVVLGIGYVPPYNENLAPVLYSILPEPPSCVVSEDDVIPLLGGFLPEIERGAPIEVTGLTSDNLTPRQKFTQAEQVLLDTYYNDTELPRFWEEHPASCMDCTSKPFPLAWAMNPDEYVDKSPFIIPTARKGIYPIEAPDNFYGYFGIRLK